MNKNNITGIVLIALLIIGYGWYTHFAVSLHMYDRDKEKLAKIVKNPISKPIEFDREKFFGYHEHLYRVAKECDKKTLMWELDQLDIYKEDK